MGRGDRLTLAAAGFGFLFFPDRFGQTSSAWWRHLREGVDGETTVDAACSLSELRCTHESSRGRYVDAISEDQRFALVSLSYDHG